MDRIEDMDAAYRAKAQTHGVCSDIISRADAMGGVQDHFNADGFKGYDDGQKMMDRIKALPSAEPVDCTDFIRWIRDEVLDEENWEMNAVAKGEIIARKLKKLNAVFCVGGYYHSADRPPYRIDPYGTAWVNAHDGQDLDKVGRVILDNFPYAKTFYADRPKGEWEETESDEPCWYRCSECARRTDEASDYCPNCGADMRGGDNVSKP